MAMTTTANPYAADLGERIALAQFSNQNSAFSIFSNT